MEKVALLEQQVLMERMDLLVLKARWVKMVYKVLLVQRDKKVTLVL